MPVDLPGRPVGTKQEAEGRRRSPVPARPREPPVPPDLPLQTADQEWLGITDSDIGNAHVEHLPGRADAPSAQRLSWPGGQARGFPRLESAVEVGRLVQPDLAQARRGQSPREALGTHHDDAAVGTGEGGIRASLRGSTRHSSTLRPMMIAPGTSPSTIRCSSGRMWTSTASGQGGQGCLRRIRPGRHASRRAAHRCRAAPRCAVLPRTPSRRPARFPRRPGPARPQRPRSPRSPGRSARSLSPGSRSSPAAAANRRGCWSPSPRRRARRCAHARARTRPPGRAQAGGG